MPLFITIIFIAAGAFLYVWQMTVVSMRSYVRNDLVRERTARVDIVRQLDLTILEHQSLARVSERLDELHLVRDPKAERVTREELRLSVSRQ